MEYSAWHPVIWLIFAGFIAAVYLTVKAYHKKYPDYPGKHLPKPAVRHGGVSHFTLQLPGHSRVADS